MKAKLSYVKGQISYTIEPETDLEIAIYEHFVEQVNERAENISVTLREGKVIVRVK